MKLLRCGEPGKEQPDILGQDSNIRSLAGIVDDINGTTLSVEQLERLCALDLNTLPISLGVGALGVGALGNQGGYSHD